MRPAAQTAVAAVIVVSTLCGAAWMRSSHRESARTEGRSAPEPDVASPVDPPAEPRRAETVAPAASAPSSPPDAVPAPSEEAMMDRLRSSEPEGVLEISRDIARKYPRGHLADERESRVVDALLALHQVREAHYRAQLLVQHFPDSPFARRAMMLMGVHPRPPGVVPEPPDDD